MIVLSRRGIFSGPTLAVTFGLSRTAKGAPYAPGAANANVLGTIAGALARAHPVTLLEAIDTKGRALFVAAGGKISG